MRRFAFYAAAVLAIGALAAWIGFAGWHGSERIGAGLVGSLVAIGIYDVLSPHNMLRNYPLVGHLRYIMEFISPEIRQYFLETDKNGRPYNRQQRTLIQERAKGTNGAHPFGTEFDILDSGYDFVVHSIEAKQVSRLAERVWVGGPQCARPYESSRLNISAMSFGALSSRAVLAMNKGAKLGDFAQDTGEGGLTPYHLKYGADIIWEIGSGYFGCRHKDGGFSDYEFLRKAAHVAVKMIEIKLSQGAKPGHGGLLPAAKVNAEIAKIREVPQGEDCLSPANHSEFNSPRSLLTFVVRLRRLSGGKPIGFKLCVGKKSEFLAICKAMLEMRVCPDFITVDGAEGGTGAAPFELTDKVGLSINEALMFVHSSLVGCDLREQIRVMASGKIVTGFDMIQKIALGADVCNVARPMMFAVGCVQSLRCHTDKCPTGVATQNKSRARAIDVERRAEYVRNYHRATLDSFKSVLGAMGLTDPKELTSHHILHRMPDQQVRPFDAVYPFLPPGALLDGTLSEAFADDWRLANADHF